MTKRVRDERTDEDFDEVPMWATPEMDVLWGKWFDSPESVTREEFDQLCLARVLDPAFAGEDEMLEAMKMKCLWEEAHGIGASADAGQEQEEPELTEFDHLFIQWEQNEGQGWG